VQDFLNKLNEREKGKGWTYRLPKRAEWEYACRNAAQTKEECSFDFYFANGTNDLSSNEANFDGNHPSGNGAKGKSLGRPTKVGSYRRTSWGCTTCTERLAVVRGPMGTGPRDARRQLVRQPRTELPRGGP